MNIDSSLSCHDESIEPIVESSNESSECSSITQKDNKSNNERKIQRSIITKKSIQRRSSSSNCSRCISSHQQQQQRHNRQSRKSSSSIKLNPNKRIAGYSREGSTSTRIFKTSDAEFSLREIYGDGNCLFRAISFIVWGTESRHRYLRSLVVNHIVSTWREIKPFVQAEWSIGSLREYMGFMDADGTFASELECVIATKLNRLNLAIYRRADASGNLRRILYSQYDRRAPTANLLFSGRNEFGHYDVLLPVR